MVRIVVSALLPLLLIACATDDPSHGGSTDAGPQAEAGAPPLDGGGELPADGGGEAGDAGDPSDAGPADAAPDAGSIDAGPHRCGDGRVRNDSHPTEAAFEECDGSPGCTNACRLEVRAMVATNATTCILRADSQVYCRGFNADRTMGQGPDQTSRYIDGWRAVPGLDNIVEMDGGRDWLCARREVGPLLCWGVGSYDRGPVHPMAEPVVIEGTDGATSLGIGPYTGCFTASEGVSCWGRNLYKMLGDVAAPSSPEPQLIEGAGNISGNQPLPRRVGSLESVVDVAVHDTGGCALTADGELYCWGSNWSGQSGARASSPLTPTRVHEQEVVHTISTQAYAGCYTAGPSRQLHCFGVNVWGNAADASLRDLRDGPVAIVGMTDIEGVEVGIRHGCAWTAAGSRYCWGKNEFGQAGVVGATPLPRMEPFLVESLNDVVQIAAGEWHFCARHQTGELSCWGSNGWGELGGGPSMPSIRPRAVSDLPSVIDVSAGTRYTCAVGTDLRAYCWGSNLNGRLGLGDSQDRDQPTALALDNVVQVAASSAFGCLRQADGAVWCWGYNGEGVLGQGDRGSHSAPQRVPNIASQQLAVGYRHVCSLSPTGYVSCWGYNPNGQLGRGHTSTRELSPAPVNVPVRATGLTVGAQHTCASTEDGLAYCWGYNGTGALGDGTTTRRPSPVAATGLAVVENLTAWKGGHGTCATSAQGTRAYCWGNNYWGTVGDGAFSNRRTPVELPLPELLGSPVAGFAGSYAQVCAWGTAGQVACWGDPAAGRTGNASGGSAAMAPREQLPFSR